MDQKIKTTKYKLKKPLILSIFILVSLLSAITRLKEQFHFNKGLREAFDDGALAATYAQYAYLFTLVLGSFLLVLLIKVLWNNLIPRITNWREIDYWEAMGITAFILLFTLI